MVGKLTRSLSGVYVCHTLFYRVNLMYLTVKLPLQAASPADSALNLVLQDLAHSGKGKAAPLLEV